MLARLWKSGVLIAALVGGAGASTAPADLPPAKDPRLAAVVDDLVVANHALYRTGVIDGNGHVSVRSPLNPNRLLIASATPPALVTAADVIELDLDCNRAGATPADAKLYGERFIHCEVYRARPDVNAVIHSHARGSVAFSVMDIPMRPIMQTAAFMDAKGAPVFDGSRDVEAGQTMIVDKRLGAALAARLGSGPVVLLRSHGNVIVGLNIPNAVERALYTEWNAQTLLSVLAAGPKSVTYLSPTEVSDQGKYQNTNTSYRNWRVLKAAEGEAHDK